MRWLPSPMLSSALGGILPLPYAFSSAGGSSLPWLWTFAGVRSAAGRLSAADAMSVSGIALVVLEDDEAASVCSVAAAIVAPKAAPEPARAAGAPTAAW